MLFDLADLFAELITGKEGLHPRCQPARDQRLAGSPQDGSLHLRNRLKLHIVGGFRVLGPDIDDQEHPLPVIVKGNDLVKEHHVHVTEFVGILRLKAERGLRALKVIVGKIPDQASCKRRKALHDRSPVVPDHLLDHLSGWSVSTWISFRPGS